MVGSYVNLTGFSDLNSITLVFLAAARLAYDLEELSPDSWLPGVETLGDLLQVCGYSRYGLSANKLNVKIFA